MRKILYIVMVLFPFIAGCDRDLETEGISKTTTFAEIVLTGDVVDAILVGTTYTDPGAKAIIGSKEVPLITEGAVDGSKTGVYKIKYSVKNEDGFEATASRMIGVITAEAAADDLTGNYQRTAVAKGISEWTKVKNGVYKCTDVGGAKLAAQYVYVFNVEKNKLIVPLQPLGGDGSDVNCTNADGDEVIDFIPGPVGEVSYNWIVINSGYGTALRSFVKVK